MPVCNVCGLRFSAPRKIQTCPDCVELRKAQISEQNKKCCIFCGNEFSSPTWHQRKYCCEECRKMALKDANKKTDYYKGRFLILDRDGFRCAYCGRSSYSDNVELHVDHVLPRCKDGDDVAGNLITACSNCNVEKGGTSLTDPGPILEEIKRRNNRIGLSSDQHIKLI
jgi:5-methylcytosine-specific restriction endonuclease McrA